MTGEGAEAVAKALVLAVDLDRLAAIPRLELKQADPSVRDAVERARRTSVDSARAVAEKLARHAVLLRRFDQFALAHDAALAAAGLYDELGDAGRDSRDDGYWAYSLMIIAIGWLHGGQIDAAHRAARKAVELFQVHRTLPTPTYLFDLVRVLVVLAQCQRQLGDMDAGRQSIVDAKAIGDELRRMPMGVPGSVPPAAWGLPVVPSAEDYRALLG